ncbi:MAG: hydrogenase formation protein HypD [Candidatus Sericytochromatia bacterium]
MKMLDQWRDPLAVAELTAQIKAVVTRPWAVMEVCGGQTHAIVRYGLDQLLPPEVNLLHGPGCPVCVTPMHVLDQAQVLARRPEVTLCSFGDMLRVPGSCSDLQSVRAAGGDVRMVYSPLDAVALAQQLPQRQIVFLAVGFETTAPAVAMAAWQARQLGLANFSLLVSHVRVPPALEALLSAPECRIQAFLAAGHVCTVMGYQEYQDLATRFRVPIVVTGFEPVDILCGLLACLRQLEAGEHRVENQYARAVLPEGNQPAQAMMQAVFEPISMRWRGLGVMPASGLGLRPEFADFDAVQRFGLVQQEQPEPAECLSGLVLQGRIKPAQCPAFGKSCTPDRPLGAPMVSAEGACAAYYRYRPIHTLPEVSQ